jgi:hypothetical protein
MLNPLSTKDDLAAATKTVLSWGDCGELVGWGFSSGSTREGFTVHYCWLTDDGWEFWSPTIDGRTCSVPSDVVITPQFHYSV